MAQYGFQGGRYKASHSTTGMVELLRRAQHIVGKQGRFGEHPGIHQEPLKYGLFQTAELLQISLSS